MENPLSKLAAKMLISIGGKFEFWYGMDADLDADL